MPDSHRSSLLIGLLIGTVLTALLLFILSDHSDTEALALAPAPTVFVPVEEPLPEVPPVPISAPSLDVTADTLDVPNAPDLSGLPEEPLPAGIVLPAAEVDALSPQERAQYEAMLQSFRQIKENADQLKRERQLLEQRLRTIEQQNKALSGELDEMRDALGEDASR